MKLIGHEESMLSGAEGKAARKCMQILTALGEIFGAEKMIPVETVQISGVSYDNLGDAGLEFLRELAADGRAKVPTTLNPAGMDTEDWRALGIPEDFARKQTEVIAAFTKMGVDATCSCTPYLIGNLPKPGAHIAWGESSAVTFANSVLGARTNKEGGPSSVAASLTGCTPAYGLHLDEHRRPKVRVMLETDLETKLEFGAFGKALGEALDGRIPLIEGISTRRWDLLKALCAAFATYGGAPIFHIAGGTSEQWSPPADAISIGRDEIVRAARALDDGADRVDFVFLGCPHLSLDELREIAELLRGKTVTKELWLGVARRIKEQADAAGITEILVAAGAKMACDTCHVVAPLRGRFDTFATNSAKGIYYGRSKNRFKSVFRTTEECIRLATEK
ncbi:MAG: hypothetical protein CME06_09695 [Gemmatimonadetes bacterium]|nr:hypothetical protein [Gemmatimonadota bacterium]